MTVKVLPIEEEFALGETIIDGRSYIDFKDNLGCLSELFSCFDTHADNELVIFEDDRYTYRDIADLAARLANSLTETHGISTGDRVGLALPNSPDWIITFVALASLGVTPVLINARAADAELTHCLGSTACTFCFADRSLPVDLPTLGMMPSWDLPAEATSLPRVQRNGSDEALLMFTSGTTGKPKAATLNHQGLLSALKTIRYSSAIIASQMAEQYGIDYETIVQMRPPPVTLLMFPLFHVSGCHAVFLSALTQGGKVVLMQRWNAERALQLIEREKITGFPGVPAMHWDILRLASLEDYDLSSLTTLSVGGQGTAPALLEAIHETFPSAVLGTGYGMTECNGTVTLNIGEGFLKDPKCSGQMVATVSGEIRDEAGTIVPAGDVGEIYVRGISLMSGYANYPNDEVFDSEGWMATGDIGYFDADGKLYIVDRRTDMVISGGENIYCAEIEQAVERHETVDECAAFGLADDRLGEKLAVVVRTLNNQALTSEALLDHCAGLLTKHKLPREVFFVSDPLPRNASGKLVKRQLREQFGDNS